MKRDNAIQKSFRKEINLQTQIVKDKKSYTRKMKHKQRITDGTTFEDENSVVSSSLYANNVWGINAA